MSGGSRNYAYAWIDSEYCGKMYDRELNDLMNDICNLAKAVEWYESGDTSEETYREQVAEFKEKWFKQPRRDRLKKYIDEGIEENRRELYKMIGFDSLENTE